MRLPLVLAAIIAGAVPTASLAGDRYGTNPQAAPGASLPSRTLGWSNKQDAPQGDQAPEVFQQPEPMALAGQFLRGRGSAAAGADLRPSPSDRAELAYAPVYPAFVPQQPYAAQARPTASPPPAAPPPTADDLPAYAPPPAEAAIPTPQRIADAAPVVLAGGERAHLYSVHRAYGLTPDAIPEPAQGQGGYVLIGPSGGGVASAPSDDQGSKSESGDDPAAAGDRPF